MRHAFIGCLAFAVPLLAAAADGDLDSTFGSGGKVRLPQAGGYHGTWMPMDVAVQSTGKIIISGWTDQGSPSSNTCFVLRLNEDGTLDTTFTNNNAMPPGYAGYSQCTNTSVVVRPDDRIVAAFPGYGYTPQLTFITQFTANGPYDPTFNTVGSVDLIPTTGDTAVVVNRIALDHSSNIVAAGTYTESGGSNDFYVARVASNGSAQTSVHYNTYFSGSYSPNSDIAYDLAIAADDSYYVGGTTKSSAGDLNCALSHHYYNGTFDAILTDNTFGGSSNLVLAKDYGSDNNDYCLAMAIQPPSGTLVLGGQSSAQLSSVIWQTATVTSVSADGSSHTDHIFEYDQSSPPVTGRVDTVHRVVVEPYDHRFLVIGDGHNYASGSTGIDIGVARFSGPGTSDGSFGSSGFALYDVGSGINPNTNHATSAVLSHGRLIIVGTAEDDSDGTDIVALRLAPFDGIFKDGYDG
jgi:uncharacterized delta-60 repeat protein